MTTHVKSCISSSDILCSFSGVLGLDFLGESGSLSDPWRSLFLLCLGQYRLLIIIVIFCLVNLFVFYIMIRLKLSTSSKFNVHELPKTLKC